MKTNHVKRIIAGAAAGALAGLLGPLALAAAPRAAAAGAAAAPGGLADKLRNDEPVIGEAANLELNTLLEYLFEKNNVPPDDRAAYLAVRALKDLDNPALTNKQRMDRIAQVAAGIQRVLAVKKNALELMNLAASLIQYGAMRPANMLEYFGENPRTQAQLRPVAEAIDLVYARAIDLAKAQMDDIGRRITPANQNELGTLFDKLDQAVLTARFSRAMNKHFLAMSLDKASPDRAKHAQEGLKELEEFLDPELQLVHQVTLGMGKLNADIATKESVAEGKKRLGDLIKDDKAPWGMRFEAHYFSAIGDVAVRDFAAARKGAEALAAFLKSNPPQGGPAAVAEAETVQMMLDYRINAAEAEALGPERGKASNDRAIAVLTRLQEKRKELTPVINEQLMARLPDDPDVKKLPTLLLQAMMLRGRDEVLKPKGEPRDAKALAQGRAAAQEIESRGKQKAPEVTAETLSLSAFLKAYLMLEQGYAHDAGHAFLDYVRDFNDERKQLAFEQAWSLALELRKSQADKPQTTELYNRFIEVAVQPPFNRAEFAFDFARVLIERNELMMRAQPNAAQRAKVLSDADRAAALFRKVTEPPARVLFARFFELQARDQGIDMSPSDAPDLGKRVAEAQAVANEVIAAVDAVLADAGVPEDRKAVARAQRVHAVLLAAGLAGHAAGPDKNAAMERGLKLLDGIEAQVQGMPNADAFLGPAFHLRVKFQMALGRANEALDSLIKYMAQRPDQDPLVLAAQVFNAMDREFEVAVGTNDRDRMAELAGNRVKLSQHLMEHAEKSDDAKQKERLPRYRRHFVQALQHAAVVETDDIKQKGYLTKAMELIKADLDKDPDNRALQYHVAQLHFQLGNYAAAQPLLVGLLNDRQLGKAMVPASDATDAPLVPNNQWWEANYQLLKANAELHKAKAAGFADPKVLEETKTRLKGLFILYPGEPGGPKWAPKLEELRKELIPDWVPETTPGTQPATQPSGVAAG